MDQQTPEPQPEIVHKAKSNRKVIFLVLGAVVFIFVYIFITWQVLSVHAGKETQVQAIPTQPTVPPSPTIVKKQSYEIFYEKDNVIYGADFDSSNPVAIMQSDKGPIGVSGLGHYFATFNGLEGDRYWDVDGKEVKKAHPPDFLASSRNEQFVLHDVLGRDIEIWDFPKQQLVGTISLPDDLYNTPTREIGVFNNGNVVLRRSNQDLQKNVNFDLYLYELTTEKIKSLGAVLAYNIDDKSLSPDAKTLAYTDDKALNLLNVTSGAKKVIPLEVKLSVNSLLWSPDGTYLALQMSNYEGDFEKYTGIFDTSTGKVEYVDYSPLKQTILGRRADSSFEFFTPKMLGWSRSGSKILLDVDGRIKNPKNFTPGFEDYGYYIYDLQQKSFQKLTFLDGVNIPYATFD